jgi:hypothetical protein
MIRENNDKVQKRAEVQTLATEVYLAEQDQEVEQLDVALVDACNESLHTRVKLLDRKLGE